MELERNAVAEWIEEQMEMLPDFKSGEEDYQYVSRMTAHALKKDRPLTIEAIRYWLRLRKWGWTSCAVRLVEDHHLIELKDELKSLLDDGRVGKALAPCSAGNIEKALKAIS